MWVGWSGWCLWSVSSAGWRLVCIYNQSSSTKGLFQSFDVLFSLLSIVIELWMLSAAIWFCTGIIWCSESFCRILLGTILKLVWLSTRLCVSPSVSLVFWAGMSVQTSPLAAAVTQLWGEVGTALSSASTQVLCTCRPALTPSSHILPLRGERGAVFFFTLLRTEHLRRERLSGTCESPQTCRNTRHLSSGQCGTSLTHQHIPHDAAVQKDV